jgi:hypothetical protein
MFRWWRRGLNGGAKVAETTVKGLLRCGFRRTGKAMGQVYQCWWRICRESFFFPSSIFCVIYPMVTYLLTLPRVTSRINHKPAYIYCHVSGIPWRIITGSELDDWIYWRCYYNYTLLQSLTKAHTLNSFWTTSVWRIFMKNLPRITHCLKCTSAGGIKVTMSNSSSVLCCHGNAFVHIRCRGNRCLLTAA